MRELIPAPLTVLDPNTQAPNFGSFRGSVGRIDWKPLTSGHLDRAVRRKRWMYVATATDDLYIAAAVVRLGYAANAFCYVYDKRSRRMLAHKNVVGPSVFASVSDTDGEGCCAEFSFGGSYVAVRRPVGSSAYDLEVRMRRLDVRASLESARSPSPLTAIVPIEGANASLTIKRSLLEASGELRVNGERRTFRGGLSGTDYTHGLLARNTKWRWGYALGTTTRGEKIAFNVVQGFVGEPECAVWLGSELIPVGEGRFVFDEGYPMGPWKLTTTCGALDLTFTPGAMHAEKRNLGIISSNFVQPVGTYDGYVRLPGRAPMELKEVLGVAEDQNMRW